MKRPKLLAIVNLTPDSFSGDGALGAAALHHARGHIAAGADYLDIGAESTRPGAQPITPTEEWTRLAPLIEKASTLGAPISLDTRHPATAEQALALGISMLNDQGALNDAAMLTLLAAHTCPVVVMHSLGLPANPSTVLPSDTDMIATILHWKAEVTARAIHHGIAPQRLIFDPGVGFGKTPEQSLTLVLKARHLIESGGQWLFGHSRKSFLTLFTDAPAAERDALTLACSAQLAAAGVHYLRVHNVAAHHRLFDRLCT